MDQKVVDWLLVLEQRIQRQSNKLWPEMIIKVRANKSKGLFVYYVTPLNGYCRKELC